ncbi:MAG: hypothetical protein ABF335_04065 [Alphaproteobacteria bacterium]
MKTGAFKTKTVRMLAFAVTLLGSQAMIGLPAQADAGFDKAFDAYYSVAPSRVRLEADLPRLLDEAVNDMGFSKGTPQYDMVMEAGADAMDATRAHFRDQEHAVFEKHFSEKQMKGLTSVFSNPDVRNAIILGAKARDEISPYTDVVFRDELQRAILNLLTKQSQ